MLRWLWLSLVVVIVDQLTKWVALAYFESLDPSAYQAVEVTPFFNIILVFNTGAAFSMFSEAAWGRWFLTALAVVVSVVIVFMVARAREHERWSVVGLCLVLGGAVGNLIDRIFAGKITDFLDFHAYGYHFATFNVADVAISIGAALLVIMSFFTHDEPH